MVSLFSEVGSEEQSQFFFFNLFSGVQLMSATYLVIWAMLNGVKCFLFFSQHGSHSFVSWLTHSFVHVFGQSLLIADYVKLHRARNRKITKTVLMLFGSL